MCSILRPGMSEIEAATRLEIFWKQKGAKGVSFDPIIAFGANSSMPHHRSGKTVLEQGMPILIDIGVHLDHYCSDMTRMVYLGEPAPEMAKIHDVAAKAQKAAIEMCRPGVRIGDLDLKAREIIDQAGFGPRFTHGLGHGVGLEIHEDPIVRNRPPHHDLLLEPGMVITIEPGIYFSGIGGVRIEDTLAITEDGHENFTCRPTAKLVLPKVCQKNIE